MINFFEYLQALLNPVLGALVKYFPEYALFILAGISGGLAYAYWKVDPRSWFAPFRGGFIIVFGSVIFLLLEAILK